MHSRLFIGGGRRFFESDEFAHIACDGSLRDTWDFYVRTATNIFYHHLTVLQPEEFCRERLEDE